MPEGKAEQVAKEEVKTEKTSQGSAEERLARLESENASLLKETLSKKEQIRSMEAEKANQQENLLKEQNKYKELYEGSLAKAKRADELEPVFSQLLDAETALIPEDKRDLIPAFEKPEQKLLWLQKAKSQGIFGVTKEVNKAMVVKTVQSKLNSERSLPEFVSWDKTDSRLATLNLQEYQVWKSHNTKPSVGVGGWGSQR